MTAVLTEEDLKFQRRLQSTVQTVKAWDADVDLIQNCRSQIPWKIVRDKDGMYSKPEDRLLQGNALLLQRLSRWFQKSMTWVNSPPCSQCGNKNCEGKGSRGPETDEEKNGQASRVEGKFNHTELKCLFFIAGINRLLKLHISFLFTSQSIIVLNVMTRPLPFLVTIACTNCWKPNRDDVENMPICLDSFAGPLDLKPATSWM
jgi:hypothetical protein